MEFRHVLLTACIIASMTVHADDGVPASPDPQDSDGKPARDPDAEPAAKLEDVIVTAVPIGQTADEIVTPVSVVANRPSEPIFGPATPAGEIHWAPWK